MLAQMGCWWDPHGPSYTNEKPKQEDIVGTWVPDSQTLRYMRERGNYNSSQAKTRLELKADSRFEMTDMPDWWWKGAIGKSYGTYHSSSGTWELSLDTEAHGWAIDLSFPDWSTNVNLTNQRPPYFLHFIIGDPDSGDHMTFTRR
jgi:hypothetical protein